MPFAALVLDAAKTLAGRQEARQSTDARKDRQHSQLQSGTCVVL